MTLVKVNNTGARPFGHLFNELLMNCLLLERSFGSGLFAFSATNIHETPEAFHLELNVPGRYKEDFKMNVENNLLTISFEKKEETKSEELQDHSSGNFTYKIFKRSFNLDEQIDADKIQAKYENGLLKLFLPKKAEVKKQYKQINID